VWGGMLSAGGEGVRPTSASVCFLLSVRPEQVEQAEVVAGRVPPPGAFKKAKRAETLAQRALFE